MRTSAKSGERGEPVKKSRERELLGCVLLVNGQPKQPRVFGAMRGRIIIHDQNWAKPQNDIEAWLRGDV